MAMHDAAAGAAKQQHPRRFRAYLVLIACFFVAVVALRSAMGGGSETESPLYTSVDSTTAPRRTDVDRARRNEDSGVQSSTPPAPTEAITTAKPDRGDGATRKCASALFEAASAELRPAVHDAEEGEEKPAVVAHRDRLRAVLPQVAQVYVVHYTGHHSEKPAAADRAKAVADAQRRRNATTAVLAAHGIVADVWVTALDREKLTEADRRCLTTSSTNVKPLLPSQVSVNAKHHWALYDVVKGGLPLALVLEDDVLLKAGFVDHLQDVIGELQQHQQRGQQTTTASRGASALGFDVAWVGGCMRMKACRPKFHATRLTPHAYAKVEARCAHAYLVTAAGAARLLRGMPFMAPIDFQYTRAMKQGSAFASVWVDPWLAVQGDYGGCVTQELNAPCVSTHRYAREYDAAYANDTTSRRWTPHAGDC